MVLTTACATIPEPPSPVASTALEPDTEPAASVRSSTDAAELEATGDVLSPGRYTNSGFTPPITIELDGGWEAVQEGSGFFDVQQRVGDPDVIAVQFARVTGVYGDAGTADAPEDHDDAERILRANPGVDVIEASDSRIGGLTGSQITIENAGELHASVLEVPPGPLGIDPGRRLWIAFFDTDAGLLAIMVGGSVAEWQAALDAAEPVLETIEINP
jgi:hypothetical protein